jgi:hypothetical protein
MFLYAKIQALNAFNGFYEMAAHHHDVKLRLKTRISARFGIKVSKNDHGYLLSYLALEQPREKLARLMR